MKPYLFIMIGISASGKSTIANKLAEKENCVIVSSDAIRGEICEGGVSDQSKNEEVFQIFHKRIRSNLETGHNVIADATNITVKSRKAILDAVNNIDCYIVAFVIDKELENCIKDNNSIYREYPVPKEVIYRQYANYQTPTYEEKFDHIVFYKVKKRIEMVEEGVCES